MLWYDGRVRRLWNYFIYLILIWGSFRYFVRLPEVIEELWFKPVLWLLPLFWWNMALKEKIVMFGKRWGMSLGGGFLIGVVYLLLLKNRNIASIQFDINLLGVALATAVTEELAFSGFLAGYLEKIRAGKWTNFLIIGLMTAIIRIPILVFIYSATEKEIVGVMLVAIASGMINAWLRVRTGNVAGSIIARLGLNLATLG